MEGINISRSTENHNQLSRGLANQAILLMETDNIKAAIKCFSEAVSLEDGDFSKIDMARLEIARGEMHYRLRKYDNARSSFLRAYDRLKNFPSRFSLLSLVHHSLGKINLSLGEQDKTLFNMDKAKNFLYAAVKEKTIHFRGR